MTARSVFVFFDPNCPYCAKLWQAKINNQTFREIPAVWIPVTYLGDSALGKGAALLRTGSPSSLEQNFTKFDYEKRQGGIDSVVATDKEKRELGQAKAVWMDLGAATPLIVYRHKNGKISSMLGLPSDEKLSEISNQFAPSFLSVLPSK